MKKILLGLVVAIMMTGKGYTELRDTEVKILYADPVIGEISTKVLEKLQLKVPGQEIFRANNYDVICKVIKDEIGNALRRYVYDKLTIKELYRVRDRLDYKSDRERISIFDKEIKNRKMLLYDLNWDDSLTKSNLYNAVCKD